VWGVIWLIIAFCFFILGIIIGIVAFKVGLSSPPTTSEPHINDPVRRVVGIVCTASRGCEALFAHAWLEQRARAAGSCAAGFARRYAVVCGYCVAVIAYVDWNLYMISRTGVMFFRLSCLIVCCTLTVDENVYFVLGEKIAHHIGDL
jgi:hypothetical protein